MCSKISELVIKLFEACSTDDTNEAIAICEKNESRARSKRTVSTLTKLLEPELAESILQEKRAARRNRNYGQGVGEGEGEKQVASGVCSADVRGVVELAAADGGDSAAAADDDDDDDGWETVGRKKR